MTKKMIFRYDGHLQLNAKGLVLEDARKFDEFLSELNEEVTVKTGYTMAEDYSLYIGSDYHGGYRLLADSSDDNVREAVDDYIDSHFNIVFEQMVLVKEAK